MFDECHLSLSSYQFKHVCMPVSIYIFNVRWGVFFLSLNILVHSSAIPTKLTATKAYYFEVNPVHPCTETTCTSTVEAEKM